MLLSEAQVLFGFGGGRTFTTRLAVVRQALFVGGFFGLTSAWLTTLATRATPPVGEWVGRTAVGVEAGVLIVCLAVLWNVEGPMFLDRLVATGLGVVTAAVSLSVSRRN
jgi:hypothetical protein